MTFRRALNFDLYKYWIICLDRRQFASAHLFLLEFCCCSCFFFHFENTLINSCKVSAARRVLRTQEVKTAAAAIRAPQQYIVVFESTPEWIKWGKISQTNWFFMFKINSTKCWTLKCRKLVAQRCSWAKSDLIGLDWIEQNGVTWGTI